MTPEKSPTPPPAPSPWLFPVITLVVTLGINLATFAYFSGQQNQKIENNSVRITALELEKKERDTYNAQVARAAEMQAIVKRLQDIEPAKQPLQSPTK